MALSGKQSSSLDFREQGSGHEDLACCHRPFNDLHDDDGGHSKMHRSLLTMDVEQRGNWSCQ
eukprot:scaffold456321_cov33-Prasinocladus_malaysianus.AAC.1